MDLSLETTDTSLTITRIFKASPEELWELWTDPAKLGEWHRPNMTDFTTKAEVDARVGGAYKIAMTHDGATDTAYGVFKELKAPEKMVYTWQWQGDPSDEPSEVTVLFVPVPEGTKLTLVHERLSGPEAVQAHGEGWLGCMENINVLISK